MKIDKNYPGLKMERPVYHLDGDLISNDSIIIDLDKELNISGRVYSPTDINVPCGLKANTIEAGDNIKTDMCITSEEDIKAGKSICTGASMFAGRDIRAGGSLVAGQSIEAGGSIAAVNDIKAGCSEEYGYEYGYIEAKESISAGGTILAEVSIEARNGDIDAGENIAAYDSVIAGGHIKTNKDIIAGKDSDFDGNVIAGTFIDAKKIFAGHSFDADEEQNNVICAELRNGNVCRGRLIIKN